MTKLASKIHLLRFYQLFPSSRNVLHNHLHEILGVLYQFLALINNLTEYPFLLFQNKVLLIMHNFKDFIFENLLLVLDNPEGACKLYFKVHPLDIY